MIELYVGGSFAIDATDPRNQFHEQALLEARIATDHRHATAAEPVREPSMMKRLRLAIAGGPAVQTSQDCATCPA